MKKLLLLINVAVTLLMFICAAFVCSCSEKEIEELKDIVPVVPVDSTEYVAKGYYEIPKEYIKDWDTGILTTDKHYFLVRKDSASNGYECYMNDSVNSTKGVAIYLDAECKLTKMIFTEGMFGVEYNDSLNQAYICYIDSTGVVAEDVIDLPTEPNSRSLMLTRSSASTIGDIVEGVIDGKGYIDQLGTLGDFVSGDWDNAFTSLGIDAMGILIGAAVGGVPGTIVGFAIGEMINYLRDQGEKLDEMNVQLLLGDSNAQIYEVKRTGIYTYKVVVASRLFTSNRNVSFRIGLYIRENFNTVNDKYHTFATETYEIAGDGAREFTVNVTNANGTYFAVPVLIPYRQYSTGTITELPGFKRYGGVVKLEGDLCKINNVSPGKCVKNGSDYDFDVKVSGVLLCTDDVRSWGVDLYVYQVLNDYREQKVGTIDYPRSTSSYTLSFEGTVPEKYLYKDDNHFDMRAVPFAISDRGERVVGKAQTFTLKAGGCGCTDDHHPHMIDLGLPSGTLWACCNVGASSPEEYGDYFAWGETQPKTNYSYSTYKYCNDPRITITKYCTDSNHGIVDNKTELEPMDDAATANWGSDWQMPSMGHYQELIYSNYTTTTWTTQNGVYGRKIVSKQNGNSMFLPAAGYRVDTYLYGVGSYGHYWSRSLGAGYSDGGRSLYFNSSSIRTYYDYRYWGRSVRPVRVKN